MRRGGGWWPGREGREQEVRDAEPNREGKLKRERRAGKSDGNRQQGAWAAWGEGGRRGPRVPPSPWLWQLARASTPPAARGGTVGMGRGGWGCFSSVFGWSGWAGLGLAVGLVDPRCSWLLFSRSAKGIRGGWILDGAEKLLFGAQLLMADDGHSLDQVLVHRL